MLVSFVRGLEISLEELKCLVLNGLLSDPGTAAVEEEEFAASLKHDLND